MGMPCCAVCHVRGGERVQPFRPEISARLAELAPRLMAELEDMTDRMLEMPLRSEPAYRDLLVPEEELR